MKKMNWNSSRPIRTMALALVTALPLLAQGGTAGDASTFEEALAAWKIEALTGKTSTQSLRELRESLHAALLAEPENAALADALVEVEATWIERVAIAGDGPSAEAALASLEAAVASAGSGEQGSALERTRARAAERPAIAAVLAERAKARGANPSGRAVQGDVALRSAITDALASGDTEFVKGLGKRAIPSLSKLAIAIDGAPRSGDSVSPLHALLDLDPAAGLDVALQLVAGGDLLVKREVAQALSATRTFQDDRIWNVRPGQSDELRNPRWAEVLVGLTREPAVSLEQLSGPLSEAMRHGWYPRELVALAGRIPRFAPYNGNTTGTASPELRDVYLAILEDGDEQAKSMTVAYFLSQRDASPLLQLSDLPVSWAAAGVRQALGPRNIMRQDPGADAWAAETVLPTIDEAYLQAVRDQLSLGQVQQLVSVFQPIRKAIESGPRCWLPTSFLVEIQAREDTEGDMILLATLMTGERETEAVSTLLDDRIARNAVSEEFAVRILRRLAKADVEPTTFWAAHARLSALESNTARVEEALIYTALDEAREHTDQLERALEFVEAAAQDPDRGAILPSMNLGYHSVREIRRVLATDRRPALLERVAEWPFLSIRDVLKGEARVPRKELIGIVNNLEATRTNRGQALGLLSSQTFAPEDPPVLVPAIADLVACGEWSAEELAKLQFIGTPLEDVVLDLVADSSVSDRLIARLDLGKQPSEALARKLLARLRPEDLEESDPARLLQLAVSVGVQSGFVSVDEFLLYLRANEAVAQLAPSIAERLPRDRAIAVLRPYLLREGVSGMLFERAIGLTGGLMSDEAAELLLDVAKSSARSQDERTLAMEQFEQMVQWRETEARWRRSTTADAKRDVAVASLVATLEATGATEIQRVESVRGLGLLGATEELPRLIALLADDELGSAAREAIDALHRANEQK